MAFKDQETSAANKTHIKSIKNREHTHKNKNKNKAQRRKTTTNKSKHIK